MSNKKTFFLINNESNSQDALLVRNQFQQALADKGIIEDIVWLDRDCIQIEEKSKGAKLKQVKIEQLNYSNEKSTVEKVWRVNLEAEFPGISTKDKTPEVAVLVLQKFSDNNYKLNILLIELKSSLQPPKNKKGKIQDSSLLEIKKKFEAATSRMYMFLSLNNHGNTEKSYDRATIRIGFKWVVFYNKDEFKNKFQKADNNNKKDRDDIRNSNDEELIYEILKKPEASGFVIARTILSNEEKIKLKFIANKNREESSMTVPLKDLL